MTTVYVVYEDYDYEGCTSPYFIGSTYEKAFNYILNNTLKSEEYLNSIKNDYGATVYFNEYCIELFEIDRNYDGEEDCD